MSLTVEKAVLSRGVILDLVERMFLLLLGFSAFVRLLPAVTREPAVALILISEGLAVVFILLRKSAVRADISPYAAGIGFLGTAAPLLVTASGHELAPSAVGGGLMLAGLLLTIAAKVALNRSFGVTAANRGVKRAGPYRWLRHPMYAGYLTTQIAFLLLNPSPWNVGVYAVAWSVQVLRIRAEERVLLEDPAYQAYAEGVRFRLLPGVS